MDYEDIKYILTMLAIAIIVATTLIFIKSLMCQARWEDSGRDYKFGVLSGCLVKDGDVWVPDTSIRNIN